MPESAYAIHLENFDGPFDLLLHLIQKNQVDIYDIPIAEITKQYLDYLHAMEALDLEIASSFLVMAANLLAIKARMLLPKPPDVEEEEVDARQELVQDLLEYKRFKEAAQALDAFSREQAQYVARPNEEGLFLHLFAAENPLEGKTLADLQNAFQAILSRVEAQGRVMEISGKDITLPEKMEELYQLLRRRPHGLPFSSIFSQAESRLEMIIIFLALLELMKMKVVRISQDASYDEIYLHAHRLQNYKGGAAWKARN